MPHPEFLVGRDYNYVMSLDASAATPIAYPLTIMVEEITNQDRISPASTVPLRMGEFQGYRVTMTGNRVVGEGLPQFNDEIKSLALVNKLSDEPLEEVPADLFNANKYGRLTVTQGPNLDVPRGPSTWRIIAETGDVRAPAA